jgi:hypothetical protein
VLFADFLKVRFRQETHRSNVNLNRIADPLFALAMGVSGDKVDRHDALCLGKQRRVVLAIQDARTSKSWRVSDKRHTVLTSI